MPAGPKEKPFTVYIAGPMSAYKDDLNDPYGFQQFHAAARRLREMGVVVMSPAETGGQVRIMPRSWYFAFDFAVIAQCDAVVCLPHWERSRGAKAEVIYATEMGIPVYRYDYTDGLGDRILVTNWHVGSTRELNDGSWQERVRHDVNIGAPVEAFPPALRTVPKEPPMPDIQRYHPALRTVPKEPPMPDTQRYHDNVHGREVL